MVAVFNAEDDRKAPNPLRWVKGTLIFKQDDSAVLIVQVKGLKCHPELAVYDRSARGLAHTEGVK